MVPPALLTSRELVLLINRGKARGRSQKRRSRARFHSRLERQGYPVVAALSGSTMTSLSCGFNRSMQHATLRKQTSS